MSKARTRQYKVKCVYGSCHTPDVAFVFEHSKYGSFWAIKGSGSIHLSREELFEGVDVEELDDVDVSQGGSPITTLKQLVARAKSRIEYYREQESD